MRPTASVILLTVLTGAGYGLLAWLGVLDAAGLAPATPRLGIGTIALGLAFATAGLIASAGHLGRPERAWRAFSQWRTSWLSREGVVSLLVYPPALAWGGLWLRLGAAAPLTRAAALVTAVLALGTVMCTGMIYASLPPIRQWHNRLTMPVYLVFALYSGAVLLAACIGFIGGGPIATVVALVSGAGALLAKRAWWRQADDPANLRTPAQATGLGFIGPVRQIEAPHVTENYLLHDMGYVVARRHAVRLRRLVMRLGFAVPLVLAVLSFVVAPGIVWTVAALSVLAALAVERWLFFAEATHMVTLYYGRNA